MSQVRDEAHSQGGNAGPEQVDSIIFVGGGDNGLLTALALKRILDDVDISVIDDFDEPLPQVGKSTLALFETFLHQYLDIDRDRLAAEVPLGFKTTVYFKDWCGIEPFHSPLGNPIPVVVDGAVPDPWEESAGPEPGVEDALDHPAEYFRKAFDEFYYRYQEREFSEVYGKLGEQVGQTPFTVGTGSSPTIEAALPDFAYHFNTRDFNEFLRSLCQERGVELINDRIREVETEDNRIERLGSETSEYVADLYVDSSGFSRVLMSELENSFVELDLPVDSAVKASTDIPLSDIESATVVTAGDAGWFWQIDTVGARDIGYVYSSSHISDEAAQEELLRTRDEDIHPDDVLHYSWVPGLWEKPWVTNCVAVGNAMGFGEPLHSFALTAAAALAYRLAKLFLHHGQVNHKGLRTLYNTCARTKWDEIYKFQTIFYQYNSGSTQFWEDARSIDPGVIEQVQAYQDSGFAAPAQRDILTRTEPDQNRHYLYYLALRNLGVDSRFFENLEYEVDPEVVEQVEEYTASLPDRIDDFLTYEEFSHLFSSWQNRIK